MKDVRDTVTIGIVGLGYVGLPLALAFARRFKTVIGFDKNERKIRTLLSGHDPTQEGFEREISQTTARFTAALEDLSEANFIIVVVPTPVDSHNKPDLRALMSACEDVGGVMKKGATVVFESTVYPGVTEDICGPILARASGLEAGKDFTLGYSPERVNPGDKAHTIEKITKVVSGQDAATCELIATVYGEVVEAGIYRATSIKVAEAAKVIENTQRDLNIALMNELAIIFDKVGIATRDVLEAAGTKWNFLPFVPGLVGGHCIGVDPYWLTYKAEEVGYHPQVILAGRRINDGMGSFVAQRTVKLLINAGFPVKASRVGVLGLTFKEDVADIRNSRVPDIVRELSEFGADVLIHDPFADPHEAHEEYGVHVCSWEDLIGLDALVIAVAHRCFVDMDLETLLKPLRTGGVITDVKGMLRKKTLPEGYRYWSL